MSQAIHRLSQWGRHGCVVTDGSTYRRLLRLAVRDVRTYPAGGHTRGELAGASADLSACPLAHGPRKCSSCSNAISTCGSCDRVRPRPCIEHPSCRKLCVELVHDSWRNRALTIGGEFGPASQIYPAARPSTAASFPAQRTTHASLQQRAALTGRRARYRSTGVRPHERRRGRTNCVRRTQPWHAVAEPAR